MGSGARGLVIIASVVVILAGIFAARQILTPILLAGFITLASTPLMQWLRTRRVPESVSITIALALTMSVLTLVALLVVGSVNSFLVRVPQYEAQLRAAVEDMQQWLGAQGFEISSQSLADLVDPGPIFSLLGGVVQGLASFASFTVLVVLVVAFMLLESAGLRGKLERVSMSRQQIRDLEGLSQMMYRYLGVKTVTSAATGLLIGLWTSVLELELFVLYGVLAFLLNYVPTVGSIVAAIPAVALAALQFGPGTALLTVIGYLVVNFVIGNGVEPRIMGAAMGLSPLVVIISLLLWGWLLGPVGALLSVPLTILVRILLASTPDLNWLSVLLGPATHDDLAPHSIPPLPPDRPSSDRTA